MSINFINKVKRRIRRFNINRQEYRLFKKNIGLVQEMASKSGCNTFKIIDCGFNQGIVASKMLDNLPNFSLIGFEIQQNIQHYVDDIKAIHPDKTIDVIYSAVTDKDGVVEYFEPEQWGKNYKGSTTIVENKKSMSYTKPKTAKAIDFSKWLIENVTKEEFVFVKMDIEGGEYDVIKSLLDHGTIDLLDVLAVEWHSHKFPEPQRSKYLEIENRVKVYSETHHVTILNWF